MRRFNWVENYKDIIKGKIHVEYGSSLRKLILKNKLFPYKCNNCGIKEWDNKPITLEIEHKDGNRCNNCKENLELLCPNCHSQTKTFRKNRSKKRKNPISEQEIISVFNNCGNINQTLIELSLSNSGGNYKRINKILKKNNINAFPNNKSESIVTSKPKKNSTPPIKIKKSKEKIKIYKNKILNSNIDFSKKTWGVEVAKILEKSPQYSLKFVKKHLPNLLDIDKPIKKTRDEIRNNLIYQIKSSNINFEDKKWRSELSKLTGKSNWYLKTFVEKHIPEVWVECYK